MRAVLLFAWLFWLCYRLYREVFVPTRVSLDDDELALSVERAHPELGQRLISTLQFMRTMRSGSYGGTSKELMHEVVRDLPALLDEVRLDDAIKRERIRKRALAFAVSVLAFAVFAVASPSTCKIWLQRNLLLAGDVDWPRSTYLAFEGIDGTELIVPRGDEFNVLCSAEGVIPDRVRISYEFDDGASTTETMKQNTGESRFSFTFPGLFSPVQFYAFGGDGLTRTVRVRLVDRPVLTTMQLSLAYPEYMKRERFNVDPGSTEVLVPRGSRLFIRGKANKPLEEAAIAVGKDQIVAMRLAEDHRSVEGEIAPEESGILSLRLRDRDGMNEGEGHRLLLRVVADKAPKLRAKMKGIGTMISPMARIPVDLIARDDFGLEKLELFDAVGDSIGIGSEEQNKLGKDFQGTAAEGLENFAPGAQDFEGLVRFDLLPLLVNQDVLSDPKNPVRPGRFVILRFRARDNYRDEEHTESGQSALSERLSFRVVTPAELLQDLIRRQGQQRREFQKLRDKVKRDRSDCSDLASPKVTGELGKKVGRKLRQLSRHQRHLARATVTVAVRYRLILDEMRNNRLAKEAVVLRRIGQIVDPVEKLGNSAMPALAKLISEYARGGEAALKERAVQHYDEILRMMDRVLRYMTELETFTRLLNDLRDLIRIQEKAGAEAKRRLDEELREFEGKEPKKSDGK